MIFSRLRSSQGRVLLGGLAALLCGGVAYAAGAVFVAGPRPDGSGITPQGFRLTPAGTQLPLGAGPLAVATTPDGALVLVEHAGYDRHELLVIDAHSNAVVQEFPASSDGSTGYYVGLAVSRDGRRVYASDGAGGALHVFEVQNKRLQEGPEIVLPSGCWPAGIALSADSKKLFVAGNLSDALLVVDAASGAVERSVPVGHRPYGVVVARDAALAYVSNWGGNTLSVVDLLGVKPVTELLVGTHPSAIVQSPNRPELYVANSDSDDVTVVDSRRAQVLRTIDLRPFPGAPLGASPNALAVSRDGKTLYVANAGSNALAVVELASERSAFDRALGLIPTGWYPSGVALAPDGETLFVTNMKGLGVGRVAPDQYIADLLRGTLSKIRVPAPAELRDYTRQVWSNVKLPSQTARSEGDSPAVLPRSPGEQSPIRHVIYVMKENRTYDQVLGDLPRGNGDPSLTLFGDDITPNQHELARRFATFDNFYADGEVSADGWTWVNAANANSYNQKNWPLDYGWSGRLYDFGGFGDPETAAFPGDDPARSFFWDRLAEHGISYRNYGFFVNGAPVSVDSSMRGLQGHTDLQYPGWDLGVSDQARIDHYLTRFRAMQAAHRMPTVQFVYLPRDHTEGTYPGTVTPRAMVADNDLALGRLVEAISHSEFWPSTAIFVTEDDAQDGPDHVDGHRTLAFVASPYTQTGRLDSTFYSGVSMLRTMELIVGVEPMTQFDALATPMRAAFSAKPNLRPYEARLPSVALDEVTPADAPLAQESALLDFSGPDSADHRVLNAAIWQSVRGAGTSPPPPHRLLALGASNAPDADDR